jgi:hypothetical protein
VAALHQRPGQPLEDGLLLPHCRPIRNARGADRGGAQRVSGQANRTSRMMRERLVRWSRSRGVRATCSQLLRCFGAAPMHL